MPGDPTQNGSASPDLNQIPSALIERVEVLTGGASAVYGADAVAGVVNFIMNDNFEGVRVDAQYSLYQHNQHSDTIADLVRGRDFGLPESNVTDGNSKDITFVAGINTPDGRGNATVYVGYRELDAIKQDQRDFSACALGSSGAAPGPFTCSGSSTSAAGRFITRDGNFDSTIGPDNRLRDWSASDQFNFAPDNYYQRPDERKTAGLFAHYDFSEKASVYTEFMFMDDRTLAQVAASGAFIGQGPGQPPFFGDQLINCDNPFLTPDQLDAWCGGNANAGDIFLTIGRRNVEGGGRIDDLRHTSFRGVIGMRGDIADGWNYDVYGLYGTSILSENFQNDMSRQRVGKALNAVVDTRPDSQTLGQTVCRVNADVDLSNDDPACVPWNIFNIGGVTPAAAGLPAHSGSDGRLDDRAGAERLDLRRPRPIRRQAADGDATASRLRSARNIARSDPSCARTPRISRTICSVRARPRSTRSGSFDVRELFAELRVPILQEQTLARTLSFETGYRYSDYNLGFDTDSYKLGLDWAPVDSVRLRGSYQRAVRSPNIQELFLQPRVQLNGVTDPCAGDLTNATTGDDPTASFEQCARSGVTAAQYGNILVEPGGAVQRTRERQSGPRSGGGGYVLVRHRAHAVVPAELQPVGRLLRHQGRKADRHRRPGFHPRAVSRGGHGVLQRHQSRGAERLAVARQHRLYRRSDHQYGIAADEGNRRRGELSLRRRQRRPALSHPDRHVHGRAHGRAAARRTEIRLRRTLRHGVRHADPAVAPQAAR